MLTFLRRLPDNSVSIISSGLDEHVLPNATYRYAVEQEMARVLDPQGLFVLNSGLGIDPKVVEKIYEGSIFIFEKRNEERSRKLEEEWRLFTEQVNKEDSLEKLEILQTEVRARKKSPTFAYFIDDRIRDLKRKAK